MFSIFFLFLLYLIDQTSKLKYVLREARYFLIKSNNHENVSLAKAKVCILSHFFFLTVLSLKNIGNRKVCLLFLPPGGVVDPAREREEVERGISRG